MKTTLKNSAISAAIMLMIALVCVGSIRAYKLYVPEHVDRDTASVTLADYDRARETWDARGAHEYKVTYDGNNSSITLQINQDTGAITLLKYVLEGKEVDEGSNFHNAMVKASPNYTVEAVFDRIGNMLSMVEKGERIEGEHPLFERYHDLVTGFNAELGYPTQYVEYVRSTKGTREISWREAVDYFVVKEFQILR